MRIHIDKHDSDLGNVENIEDILSKIQWLLF